MEQVAPHSRASPSLHLCQPGGAPPDAQVAVQTFLTPWSRRDRQKMEVWHSKNLPAILVEDVPLKVVIGLQGSGLQYTF